MSLFERKENFKSFINSFPSVTLLTIVIIIIQLATYYYGAGPTDLETARRFGAIQSSDVSTNEWFRLLTYLFVQIGGTYHILANLCSLLIFGPPLEKIYGSAKFTLLFLTTGVIGGLFILVFSTNVIAAGASGSIYGLIGFYFGLILKRDRAIDKISKNIIIYTLIIYIFYTFLAPNISISAHIGGLISGILLSFFIKRKSFKQMVKTKWGHSILQTIFIGLLFFSILSFTKYLPLSNTLITISEIFDEIKLGKSGMFGNVNSLNNQDKESNKIQNDNKDLDGYLVYHFDGISIQVPNYWDEIELYNEYDDPYNTKIDFEKKIISKHYQLHFPNDPMYTVELDIYPYDNNMDINAFLSDKFILLDKYKEVNIRNADKAYELIDYKDDIYETSSRWLLVFKNDVFYQIEATHWNTNAGFIDVDRENIKQFRNEIEVIFSTFQIINKQITIEEALQPENIGV